MGFEAHGVRELSAALGGLDSEMRKALKPAVLKAGNVIGDQVKENASFSSWIPEQVKVSASFSARGGGARITVAERGYPHGGEVNVFEGDGVAPTPFEHPTYGHRNGKQMVAAMTHPFAGPAVEEKEPEAVAIVAETVSAVIAANGL